MSYQSNLISIIFFNKEANCFRKSSRYDPGAGHLVTFTQFLFAACMGLIFTSKFFTVKPVIPMREYVLLVVMFFVSNVCNNYAFNFHIPMPLHMIFRSGSLMANMVMGIVILKRSYDIWKYISVVVITLGIIVCTISSGSSLKNKSRESLVASDSFSVLFWWGVGLCLLTVALFVSARMGIYQETMYKKHGKHPNEALFYTHAMTLPGFVLLSKSIAAHAVIAIESESKVLFGIGVPIQMLSLIGVVLTNYLCIGSVYVLTTECPSLTVTLVITLRKFASLLVSIVFFKNQFTTYHWVGTSLVFIGTVIYTEMLSCFQSKPIGQQSLESATSKTDIQDSTLKAFGKFLVSSTSKRKSKIIESPHIKYQPIASKE